MELWIRSQDKMNLVKIRQINVNYRDNSQIIANYQPEMYENSGEYYELLGAYKSKERALEVLDEIQNAILGIIFDEDVEEQGKKRYTGTAIASRVSENIVYEMPEE